jgi:hypothetical protein
MLHGTCYFAGLAARSAFISALGLQKFLLLQKTVKKDPATHIFMYVNGRPCLLMQQHMFHQ